MPAVPASPLELLRGVPLFAQLVPEELESLVRCCRRRRLSDGDTLFFEGEPGHSLYVVIAGEVRIQRVTPNGKLLVIATRGPGEHVGEMALIDGEPRSADGVVVGPSEVLILDRDEFLARVRGSSQFALNVMAALARRLRQAADRAEGAQELDVLGRVAGALLELADAHGTELPGGERRIDCRVTQQGLAERIGATRVSVNKALGRLKEVRGIRTEGGQLVVCRPELLRKYCEV